jgi:hypothetical protein
VTVSGVRWPATADIVILFDTSTSVATVKAAAVQAGAFSVPFVVPSRALRGSPYQVTAQEGSGEFVVATASAPFSLPCPSLTLTPACGSAGAPVSVHGAGFRSDITVSLTFTPPAGAAPIATAVPGGDSTFDVGFTVPAGEPPGTYVVGAVQLRTQVAARAVFTIPCVKAAIKLVPTVGPPGTVVTVTGIGFPIGAAVKLTWNQGVPLALPTMTIGQSQGFQVTVLIFPHDQLGKRTMSAAPDLSVSGAPLFNIATADFLVVEGTAQPRHFTWRR